MASTRLRKLITPPEAHMRRRRGETVGSLVNSAEGADPVLSFPRDLGGHFMALMFHRFDYSKPGLAQSTKLVQTITLPVPTNLVETIQTNYNSTELGAVGGEISDLIARGSMDEITGLGDKIAKGLGGFAGEMLSDPAGTMKQGMKDMFNTGDTMNAVTLGFREGDGALAAGLNRYFASAPNPHITALFRGVGLRTHNFTWKLAPQSMEETKQLSKIVNTFRACMLPERGTHNLTLKYPDEVDIYIGGTDVDHMYHFKRAVIRNMSVNHAPDGVPSFFEKTGAPTALQINIDLMETSIHTREDYQGEVGSPEFAEGVTGSNIINKNFLDPYPDEKENTNSENDGAIIKGNKTIFQTLLDAARGAVD